MSKPEERLSAAELAELDKLKREVAEAKRERDEIERELDRERGAHVRLSCANGESLPASGVPNSAMRSAPAAAPSSASAS